MSGRLRKLGRSRVVKLPDGRKRVIDRFEVFGSAGDPATVDTEVFIAYGTAHPKYTACLLVDQPDLNFSPDQGVEQDLVRIYEEMPAASATLNEVRAGGDQITKDADGRKILTRNSIMLAAGTVDEGAPGSTVTVDGVTYALDVVTHSSNGAVRTITRRYNQANADPSSADGLGPFIPAWPFHNVGDPDHVVVSRAGEQPATHYRPPALNTTGVVTVNGTPATLYFVGDVTPPGRVGSNQVRFVRRWANKPSSRSEFGTIVANFPGICRTQEEFWAIQGFAASQLWLRRGFSLPVTCRIDFDYYRIAASGGDYTSPSSIPLVPRQVYRMAAQPVTESISPFEIRLSDVDSINMLRPGGPPVSGGVLFTRLLTSPTRTEYFALGAFGLVVDCRIQRYMGNFYERRTVRVTPI